jgi:hypothetical protein
MDDRNSDGHPFDCAHAPPHKKTGRRARSFPGSNHMPMWSASHRRPGVVGPAVRQRRDIGVGGAAHALLEVRCQRCGSGGDRAPAPAGARRPLAVPLLHPRTWRASLPSHLAGRQRTGAGRVERLRSASLAFPQFPRHRINVFEPFAASHRQPDSRSLASNVYDVDCRSTRCN